jgi:hypothetical protein
LWRDAVWAGGGAGHGDLSVPTRKFPKRRLALLHRNKRLTFEVVLVIECKTQAGIAARPKAERHAIEIA